MLLQISRPLKPWDMQNIYAIMLSFNKVGSLARYWLLYNPEPLFIAYSRFSLINDGPQRKDLIMIREHFCY